MIVEHLKLDVGLYFWYPDGYADMDFYAEDLLQNNKYHHVELLNYVDFADSFVIDIGAYVGTFSYWSHMVGAKRVAAFEPFVANYNCLVTNLMAEPILPIKASLNSQFYPYAITDSERVVHLTGYGQKVMPCDEHDCSEKSSMALGVRLDKIYDQLKFNAGDHVIIKMDIEGHEEKAIRGAEQLIKNHPNLTLILCSYHYKDQFMDLRNILGSIREDFKYYDIGVTLNGNTALLIAGGASI